MLARVALEIIFVKTLVYLILSTHFIYSFHTLCFGHFTFYFESFFECHAFGDLEARYTSPSHEPLEGRMLSWLW